MGMFANFTVDDGTVDAYKCDGSWTGTINTTEQESVSVKFWYEDGYGSCRLVVYMRDEATKDRRTVVHEEPERLLKIVFADYFPPGATVAVHIKLANELYGSNVEDNPFNDENWWKTGEEHTAIRVHPITAARSLRTKDDVFKFAEAFMTYQMSEYGFEEPTMTKDDFTNEELKNLHAAFNETKNTSSRRGSAPTATNAHKFLCKLLGVDYNPLA